MSKAKRDSDVYDFVTGSNFKMQTCFLSSVKIELLSLGIVEEGGPAFGR